MTKVCKICKKEFVKPYFESKKNWINRHIYCSDKCRLHNLKYTLPIILLNKKVRNKISNSNKGSNNNMWKGGISVGNNAHNYSILASHKRRAKELKSEGSYTLSEWEELKFKYNYMCLCCKKFEPKIKLSVDHIIPLSKKGSNDITNIQPLCGSCNSIKNIKETNYILINESIGCKTLSAVI